MNPVPTEVPFKTIRKNRSSFQINRNRFHINQQYVITFLIFLGLYNMHALRLNLNIAIVEMTYNKTIIDGNQTIIRKPDFTWDSRMKGVILSSFYYGHMLAPIGGYFAYKYGGATCYGIGVLITSIMTILTPLNIRASVFLFILSRIFEGSAEAVANTSLASIWNAWTSPTERSKLMAWGSLGAYFGSVITYPISGYIAYQYNWDMIFYLTGTVSLFWCLIWFIFAKNEPPQLSKSNCTRTQQIKVPIPWMKIIKCREVQALLLIKLFGSCSNSLMVQCFPLYAKDLIRTEVHTIGFLSSVPNISAMLGALTTGYITNIITEKKILTHTRTHKMNICVGLTVCSVLMTFVAHEPNFFIAYTYLVIYKFFYACVHFSSQLAILSIASQFSSVLSGMAYTSNNIATITSPLFVGFFVTNHLASEWSVCFMVAAIFALFSCFIFYWFGSSELQPWAESQRNEDVQQFSINK